MSITRTELEYLLEQQAIKYERAMKTAIAEALGNRDNGRWMSQAEAYRLYSRTNVERWVSKGRLRVYSAGAGKRKRIYSSDLDECQRNNW